MLNKETNSVEQESTQTTSAINSSNSRRKFFKKAASGSIIVAAASSQPVWGSCVSSISGNLSGNTSTAEDATRVFAGNAPGVYRNKSYNPDENNQTDVVTNDNNVIPEAGVDIVGLTDTLKYTSTFSELFNSGSDNTVQHVLVTRSDTDERFERHFLGAVLNSHYMADYPYTFLELNGFLELVVTGQITKSEAIPVLRFLIDGFADGTSAEQCGI